jgi:hypothetical protein
MACDNKRECPCTNATCANHAKCCDCVARHVEKGDLPFCLRPKT